MRASITLVTRILSLAAILLAGAAVASASQQSLESSRVSRPIAAVRPSSAMPASVAATQIAAYPLDQTLIARADTLAEDLTAPYVVAAPISEPAATSRTDGDGFGLPLPAPDRTTAILATCAVVGFFFLRRLL